MISSGLSFAPGKVAPVLYVATSNAVFSYQLGPNVHREVGAVVGHKLPCTLFTLECLLHSMKHFVIYHGTMSYP